MKFSIISDHCCCSAIKQLNGQLLLISSIIILSSRLKLIMTTCIQFRKMTQQLHATNMGRYWCKCTLLSRTFVESGFTYEYGKIPDAAILSKMLELSPISLVDKIQAPILLLVGKNDARVPPSQSFNFHRMLLARGIETEWVFWYLLLIFFFAIMLVILVLISI